MCLWKIKLLKLSLELEKILKMYLHFKDSVHLHKYVADISYSLHKRYYNRAAPPLWLREGSWK